MSVWDGNTPDSLLDICTKFCVKNLQTFCNYDSNFNEYYLRGGINLSTVICERMLSVCPEVNRIIDDDFLRIFQNPRATRLQRVNLNSSSITDEGLSIVLRHNLLELDISGCEKITEESFKLINDHGADLLSLNIGNSVHIFPDEITMDDDFKSNPGLILKTPNLSKLSLKGLAMPLEAPYFPMLLKPLIQLRSLDLSSCYIAGNLDYLIGMPHLTSLTLYNVNVKRDAFSQIYQIKTLRHLDISHSTNEEWRYRHPNHLLSQIIDSLPLLASLDISGTNLAGTGVAEHDQREDEDVVEKNNERFCRVCGFNVEKVALVDIPGLNKRVNNPLDFLGLFGTSGDACRRRHIPAKRITGDANELQILTAAHAYAERAEILQHVFVILYIFLTEGTCLNSQLAIDVIVTGMKYHVLESYIQVSGSACIFGIVKSEKKYFNVKTKQKVIATVLDAMRFHNTELIRNGCVVFNEFDIPQDIMFDCKRFVEFLIRSVEEEQDYLQVVIPMLYRLTCASDENQERLFGDHGAFGLLNYRRLVKILLHIVSEEEQEDFLQTVEIYLLKNLTHQADGSQKQLVGELGAIKTMLKLIENRLRRELCDDVMEVAWSVMWSATDGTPVNCWFFIEGCGMDSFLNCIRMFKCEADLLLNMMGLLANVAEVQDLRPQLLTEELVKVFSDLLDSTIEVSYNAAAVLSYIASDGRESWTITSPKRDDVLSRMVTTIKRWDIMTKRNIMYRSLEPFLRLLCVDHTPEAQYWAVWALANLTSVNPEKYCLLLQAEKGIEMLTDLIQRESVGVHIRQFAKFVINHCQSFSENGKEKSSVASGD